MYRIRVERIEGKWRKLTMGRKDRNLNLGKVNSIALSLPSDCKVCNYCTSFMFLRTRNLHKVPIHCQVDRMCITLGLTLLHCNLN